jgi:AraC-like DNA-binding protein
MLLTRAHSWRFLRGWQASPRRAVEPSSRRAVEPSSRRAVEPPAWLKSQLHTQVAAVQFHLDMHLTEKSLARRLGVSPSTCRRWFKQETGPSPRRFLLAMRGFAVSRCLEARLPPAAQLTPLVNPRSFSTAAAVAEELRFEHVDSLRRLLRRLGTDITKLRMRHGLEEFEQSLAKAF